MQVRDIMSSRLVTAFPDDAVAEAVCLMLSHHVGALPVIDVDGRLVGIVTAGDFLRRVELGTVRPAHRVESVLRPAGLAAARRRARGLVVRDVMTECVFTIEIEEVLDAAASLMERHAIRHLPVMDKGRIVGIISRTDFMRALSMALANSGLRSCKEERTPPDQTMHPGARV